MHCDDIMFARSFHLQTMYEIVLSVCCFTLWWFNKREANVGLVSLRSRSRLWESKIFMLNYASIYYQQHLNWGDLYAKFLPQPFCIVFLLSKGTGSWHLCGSAANSPFFTPYSFRTHLILIPSGQLKSGTSQLNVLRYTSIKEAISFPCMSWLSHQSRIRLWISSNMSSSCTLAFSLQWSLQV